MDRMSWGIGLMPEQVWEDPDIPAAPYGSNPATASIGFVDGKAAGSATPLIWAEGQYVRLIRDLQTGTLTDQPAITRDRYVTGRPADGAARRDHLADRRRDREWLHDASAERPSQGPRFRSPPPSLAPPPTARRSSTPRRLEWPVLGHRPHAAGERHDHGRGQHRLAFLGLGPQETVTGG